MDCRITQWWRTADEYAHYEEDHESLATDMRTVRTLASDTPQRGMPALWIMAAAFAAVIAVLIFTALYGRA